MKMEKALNSTSNKYQNDKISIMYNLQVILYPKEIYTHKIVSNKIVEKCMPDKYKVGKN